jgi:hypothetical protein
MGGNLDYQQSRRIAYWFQLAKQFSESFGSRTLPPARRGAYTLNPVERQGSDKLQADLREHFRDLGEGERSGAVSVGVCMRQVGTEEKV